MAIFNLRVRRRPFSGRADDSARLNIVAGAYKVTHEGDTLVFAGTD